MSVATRAMEACLARGLGTTAVDAAMGRKVGTFTTLVSRDGDPRTSTLVRLANVLQVNLLWLATGAGPRDRSPQP